MIKRILPDSYVKFAEAVSSKLNKPKQEILLSLQVYWPEETVRKLTAQVEKKKETDTSQALVEALSIILDFKEKIDPVYTEILSSLDLKQKALMQKNIGPMSKNGERAIYPLGIKLWRLNEDNKMMLFQTPQSALEVAKKFWDTFLIPWGEESRWAAIIIELIYKFPWADEKRKIESFLRLFKFKTELVWYETDSPHQYDIVFSEDGTQGIHVYLDIKGHNSREIDTNILERWPKYYMTCSPLQCNSDFIAPLIKDASLEVNDKELIQLIHSFIGWNSIAELDLLSVEESFLNPVSKAGLLRTLKELAELVVSDDASYDDQISNLLKILGKDMKDLHWEFAQPVLDAIAAIEKMAKKEEKLPDLD